MLNSAYESVSIEHPKKPFTEENLREVVNYYNERYSDNVSMMHGDETIELSAPREPFSLINLIELRLVRHAGYKLIDGKFIIPV